MTFIEFLAIGLGLGMDAFSVSICKGLAMHKMSWKKGAIIGIYFGLFQAIMPAIGYAVGSRFSGVVDIASHWIAFALLMIIGINMILEALKKENDSLSDDVSFKSMIILSIATSIDALAVGVSLAIIGETILESAIIIGIVTFIMSVIGVKIGNILGLKLKDGAELLGGAILIAMAIKILIT